MCCHSAVVGHGYNKCAVTDVENGRFKKKNHHNLFCALYNVNKCYMCGVSMLTEGTVLHLFSTFVKPQI